MTGCKTLSSLFVERPTFLRLHASVSIVYWPLARARTMMGVATRILFSTSTSPYFMLATSNCQNALFFSFRLRGEASLAVLGTNPHYTLQMLEKRHLFGTKVGYRTTLIASVVFAPLTGSLKQSHARDSLWFYKKKHFFCLIAISSILQ